jgi:lysine 2,3-aminomutase
VQGKVKLAAFLQSVLPQKIDEHESVPSSVRHINTAQAFLEDVMEAIAVAPMSIRLTPHTLSLIDWRRPLTDPVRRQFIPLRSSLLPDHPKLELDSLHESHDSPIHGFVHRYPEKGLFLGGWPCAIEPRLSISF